MWWSRGAILSAAAMLAACGFTPVYGPGGAASGLSGQILADAPEDAAGYAYVRQVEDRLGLPTTPLYRLAAEIVLDEDGFGITPARDTTRFQITGTVVYSLSDIASGAPLTSGTLSSFTSYSAPVVRPGAGSVAGNSVTVRAARQDAVERLMTILANQTAARLLATAPDWRP
ncbi:hypothetical protein E2L08_10660 [Palleronia sediminis]|uniref:LPS-assembly lipoprotein n=1 Tax=Palleronia sediminis TaxID=2547833 RepID=A0A4R6A695_9RHOB|nr:LPS assembly lipoprotein LptE [Palleronia sediminis]TDL78395.1 hypothetical protein E2L08_10660 [Palleronia sediminis]